MSTPKEVIKKFADLADEGVHEEREVAFYETDDGYKITERRPGRPVKVIKIPKKKGT